MGVDRVRGSLDDPDWERLARAGAGDAKAFGELIERYQGRVLRLCERLLRDPEEARDAAQEVFLKVYRKASSFRPRGRVYTLLYRIAVNHCLNQLRRQRWVRFFKLPDPGEEAAFSEPTDRAPDAAAHLEARRRWQKTRREIGRLPPGQRAVLVLAKFEGLSYKEIAEVLGITVGAVESRLFRAMRTLTRAQEASPSGVSRKGER